MRPKYIFILIFLFSTKFLLGQGWVSEENTFETNWNITFQTGRTALLGEVLTDFSGTYNDMNNQSDWGFNFQIAKMVWDRFDVGFEFGVSNFKGFKNWSGNVNWLMLDKEFNNETRDYQPFAIYYDSDITNFSVYLKYNFINFRTFTKGYLKMNLYAKIAAGVLFPTVEMGYKDQANYDFTGLTHPLYLKGRYPSPQKDSHSILNPAMGLNYQLSERIFFSAETSFQLIGADNLDGVHNFNTELKPDVIDNTVYRVRVNSLTAKFMFGVTYFFNFDTHRQARIKEMPWFENRYRSYYSRFHKPSSKQERQERLPFFMDKFTDDK